MRPGLAQYDLASMLYDPYVDLSEAERAELIEHYRVKNPRLDSGETLRLCAVQRLMQALGAYGFLGLVKGQQQFLKYIPAAMKSLRGITAGVDGVQPLVETLNGLA
jgi:N-acetylmuramate 1-kinase